MRRFDFQSLETPYYAVDERLLTDNLILLKSVADRADCKILLAQKAFSMFSLYPLVGRYLDGTAASGLYEAKLGHEETEGEVHVFSPFYKPSEFDEISDICDHIVFNSFAQCEKYKETALRKGKAVGIRINPEFSTQKHGIYDPCSFASRLGVTKNNFDVSKLSGISGFHMHTLCEQDSDALAATFEALEKNFGGYFNRLSWLNLGGGHHITRPGYDIGTLVNLIKYIKDKYGLTVYLEPGEAVALNTGYLVASVGDIVENSMTVAVLDASAACHMPDVLEMPYRPEIAGAGMPGEKKYTYRLAGNTCLAGDIIGDYSFDEKLEVGSRLIFLDMAHYTMVKNNTFNGMALPSIAVITESGGLKTVKKFGYADFKNRLS